MVTASGAPGTAALLQALRRNGEREVRLVGTDMSERSVGRHLCDAFHIVPAGSHHFPDAVLADRRAGAGRRDPAAVVVRPRGAGRARRPLPDAGARLEAGRDPAFERQGRDLRVAAPARRAGAGVPARQRRARGRRRGARARLSGPARLLQAGLLVGLARLPHPRPDGRPRAPAAERAAGLGVDAARGGGRAAARRGRPGPARDGAGDRRRADDRRDRRRREIVLGHPKTREAMRAGPRDVLRHARGPGADAGRQT